MAMKAREAEDRRFTGTRTVTLKRNVQGEIEFKAMFHSEGTDVSNGYAFYIPDDEALQLLDQLATALGREVVGGDPKI